MYSRVLTSVHSLENLRHLDVRIAQELLKMARLRLLDLRSYADTVAKKKIRTKTNNNVLKPQEKYRKVKRKLCTVLKQRDLLRAKVRVCLLPVCAVVCVVSPSETTDIT